MSTDARTDLVRQTRRAFLVFASASSTLFLLQAMVLSTRGLTGRAITLAVIGWLIYVIAEVFRSQKQRPYFAVVTALAFVSLGLTGVDDTAVSLPAVFLPFVCFESLFSTRLASLVRGTLYFASLVAALVLADDFGFAVLAQLPAVLLICFTMQGMGELINRHARTLKRHGELNAMSAVMISAEAVDEAQSAAVMAGTALLEGAPDVTFGVIDRDGDGNWVVVASSGSGSVFLRTLSIVDDDIEQITPAVLALPWFRDRHVEVVPVMGDVLLGALVWISPEAFDVEFRSSAASLAIQLAESIRRIEVEDSIRRLLAHSIDALLVVDAEGKIEYASPAVESLTGRTPDQVVGRSLSSLVHRQHVTQLVKHLHGNVVEATRFSLRWGHQATGSWKETFTTISQMRLRGSTSWVFNVHDVSEQTELELELRHAQKLESVGRLAAGVAHEINTPIQFIGHNLRFVGTSFAEYAHLLDAYRSAALQWGPAEVQEALSRAANEADIEYLEEEIPLAVNQAIEGSDRVAEIVRAMKVFGHPDGNSAQAVDVNNALTSTLIIAQNEIKSIANVVTDFNDVPAVIGFTGDLNQVFLNLVVNACHAIAEVPKADASLGTLTVSTREVEDAVLISIADTGAGIPLHIRDHVFEPFFTTKDVGQGTGQGLALAHAVVEDRHRGRIWFETKEGEGTTFFIKLLISPEHLKGGSREAIAVQ